jgi:hypothetical protein
MLGDNSVALVNPHTMVYDLITNFFGTPLEDVTPFTAICSKSDKKMLGLYMKDNEISLVYKTPSGQLIRKRQKDVLDSGTVRFNP